MHDVREVFDFHQFGDVDGSRQADPADVVAAEIDQHGVFGAFLPVRKQLRRESGVLFPGLAARTGAGNRTGEDLPVLQFDQHFRRSAHQLAGAEIHEKHIGGGVDSTQPPVQGKRLLRECPAERMGRNDLEDVAGGDVFLGF